MPLPARPTDLATPLADPPDPCQDNLMWHTAAKLRANHDESPCPACLVGCGCETLLLAQAGLTTAMGEVSLLSEFWRTLLAARRMDVEPLPHTWHRFDPEWLTTVYEHELIASVLARRDLGKLFRFLRTRGWSTMAISAQTRLATASVNAVRNGKRHITSYDVLLRICQGLGIARPLMGLGQTPPPSTGHELGEASRPA